MLSIARAYLYLNVPFFAAVGVTAFLAPEIVAARFDLLPQSVHGAAEVRGLYGGGIFSWALITLGALRCKKLSPGLFLAMTAIMGSLAMARLGSLLLDGAVSLNVPTGIAESLIAVACWISYRQGSSPEQE